MRPTVSTGDLALAAQPATRETFAPFGRVLTSGERAYLGRRGRVLVAFDERKTGPRRITDLVRYPEARRVVLSVGRTPMWVVVMAAGEVMASGESQGATPSVFLVPGGTGLVIDAGVWHAGPVPLSDAVLCEMLETKGLSDRFDRCSVRELVDAPAVRVLLPEDPSAVGGSLDLGAPNAVLLDASLHGRLRLGCLVLDALEPGEPAALERELAQAIEGLRAMWGHVSDLGEIPGISVGRDLYRDVGLEGGRSAPRAETLLAQVLAGQDVPQAGALAGALALVALRTHVPIAAYDAGSLGEQILVRTGSPGEGYEGADGQQVLVEGRPVLCDQDGPFGSPVADARRAVAGPSARRVLVVLYLPAGLDDQAVGGWLDTAAKTLLAHAGGRLAGRLLVG